MFSIQAKGYRSALWKELRKEVFKRDGYRCIHCGRLLNEKELQVHHLFYLEGKKVWEYPMDTLITLCKSCHAQEHGKIKPSSGWEYFGFEDLGDLIGECENCHTSIRYEHYIYHPNWGELTVGSQCADNLTNTDEASRIERERKSYARRMKNFIKSKRWEPQDDAGTSEKIIYGRYMVCIIEDNAFYTVLVSFLCSKKKRDWKPLPVGKMKFSSSVDAKAHVFRIIEDGILDSYIDRHYPNEMVKMTNNEEP